MLVATPLVEDAVDLFGAGLQGGFNLGIAGVDLLQGGLGAVSDFLPIGDQWGELGERQHVGERLQLRIAGEVIVLRQPP